jgi:dUTPase
MSKNYEIPIYRFAVREDLKDCGINFFPTRAEPYATGWDVRAAFEDKQSITLKPSQYYKIPLGFRTFCPYGWWFELKPRSSTFAKKSLHCLYGTIDQTYSGQLILAVQYMPQGIGYAEYPDALPHLTVEFGEAIGQIIPVKRKEMIVEQVSNEEFDLLCKQRDAIRKDGGFGSTGK